MARGKRRGKKKGLTTELVQYERIGLDSSILIYHLEGLMPYADLTELVFALLAKGEITGVISTISVTELLVKPFSLGNEEQIMVCEHFLQGLPHTTIVAPDYEIAKEAARLRGLYGLRTPDAILLSTALKEGAKVFLTNDAKLKRVEREGITILTLDDYL